MQFFKTCTNRPEIDSIHRGLDLKVSMIETISACHYNIYASRISNRRQCNQSAQAQFRYNKMDTCRTYKGIIYFWLNFGYMQSLPTIP